jgi:hypothetical protein
MKPSKETTQEIHKADIKHRPIDLLRKIASAHLEKEYGRISMYRRGRNTFWDMGSRIVSPYFYLDPRSEAFITAISKSTLKSIINERANLMCVKYYPANGRMITVYFFTPDLIIQHYAKANIEQRQNYPSWHIAISDDNAHLVLVRKNAEDVVVPVDADNKVVRYEITDEEYEQLQAVLPDHNAKAKPKQKTLKVFVQGAKGSETFSITSAMVIALLSILVKSRKPLTVKEILAELLSYGVLARGTHEDTSVEYVIHKLIPIGAIKTVEKNQVKSYALAEDIKIEVVL